MKKLVVLSLVLVGMKLFADEKPLNIAFADSFKTMRECEEGKKVAKELVTIREALSREIQEEGQKLAQEQKDLKGKATAMKKEAYEKKERELAKRQRSLEDKIRDGEEELKMTMQNKTETLASKVEEGIVKVAKDKGVDAVIDKMTGRVLYTKDDNKGDITTEAIAQVNKDSAARAVAAGDKKDMKAETKSA